ncbi:MAG: hypothetical protein KDA92_13735 [Planctomycetales bacterium]|nr:hypothetical protein [Planctomycetales bacterium]
MQAIMTIRVIGKYDRVKTGHVPHLTGTGVHLNRRDKRRRTRSASTRAAILRSKDS